MYQSKYNSGIQGLIGRMFAGKKVAHAVALITDDYIDAARSLAASIVCEKQTYPSCENCVHCQKAKKRIHPDITEISVQKDKSYISVDQIRQMRADAHIIPNEAENKVYIINGACSMNENAQNALLTILEQPPKGVYFILCDTTTSSLLPTVLSRLSVFYLDSEEKEKKLKHREKCALVMEAYLKGDEADFYLALRSLKTKEQALEFLNELLQSAADMLKDKGAGSKKELMLLYDNIITAIQKLQNSGNLSLTLAALSVGCWEAN